MIFYRNILFVMLFVVLAGTATGQVNAQEKKVYTTFRTNPEAPRIDGIFDDPVWQDKEWEKGFVQREPYENRAPSQETGFKIAYDDNNLYVAIRAFDSHADSINRRMNRRDQPDGDMVGILIDSYYDHLTSFNFIVSAAGVKTDFLMSNDGQNEDMTWDPIWYVNTSIDSEGWNTEMKIPFSQLRFGNKVNKVWGLNIVRYIFRKEEMSLWQLIPQNGNGWVHFYGELHGIDNIDPKKQLEIAPYLVAQAERSGAEEGNPFATGRGSRYDAGVDGKIGVTNDLTLDFTINPDFGQVEADPSEVNLSAYETYFQEKRPFFIEGRNITSFGLSFGDGDLASQNLFYSRRIGRKPQYYPDLEDGEYADMPGNTSILGAFKLTGKTKSGLSVGILESITAEERAEIDREGDRSSETVEPLTNYFLARAQQDFNKGATRIGGMLTSTNRSIDNPNLDFLHRSAYTGGIDFMHEWKDRKYHFGLRAYFSQVNGSTDALIRTQRSSARYFQRPDNDYASVDSSRTSLSGFGGGAEFGKFTGKIRYVAFLTWKSPGLEINDLGFNSNADEIMQIFWVGYRETEPFSIFRTFNLNINQWTIWDFGLENKVIGGNINFYTQFKNYYSVHGMINPRGTWISNTFLRGGPSMRMPGQVMISLGINTDQRKKISAEIHTFGIRGSEKSTRMSETELELSFRPLNTLMISAEPGFTHYKARLQYVACEEYNNENRYIFGKLDQKTFSLSFRLNYSVSPNMTIQYWGQPFLSAGKYTDFKRITDPRAEEYTDRFSVFGPGMITYVPADEIFEVDENTDGFADYQFGNPDYKSLEFRSNLVLRWEYKPGSSLYLVWSQNRANYMTDGPFSFGQDMGNLFDLNPGNIFLVKFSYRFSL